MNNSEKIKRVSVPELDKLLGVPFKVLDDGFIVIVDYMGADESIVQAARVSYGKGTKKVNEDRGLIRYLLRHRHTTPFEMCEIKFHVRVPMDSWRQWIRHRMANVNENSTRYSEAIDACQKTNPEEWRLQSELNKQGSSGFLQEWPATHQMKDSQEKPGEYLSKKEEYIQNMSRAIYKERLDFGVAREQARKDLPLSNYTEAYWKCDLHNLLHFLALRMDDHAQKEIRDYAKTIGEKIVAKWVPITWEAFKDYRVNALNLSRMEVEIISLINKGTVLNDFNGAVKLAESFGWLELNEKGKLKTNRERTEMEKKLLDFNFQIPWKN